METYLRTTDGLVEVELSDDLIGQTIWAWDKRYACWSFGTYQGVVEDEGGPLHLFHDGFIRDPALRQAHWGYDRSVEDEKVTYREEG
jgi:hypothetical protein